MIKAIIIEMENRKSVGQICKSKSWFFEKNQQNRKTTRSSNQGKRKKMQIYKR
jgi:hypothetical protein